MKKKKFMVLALKKRKKHCFIKTNIKKINNSNGDIKTNNWEKDKIKLSFIIRFLLKKLTATFLFKWIKK